MSEVQILGMAREFLWATLQVSGPMLAVAFLLGVCIGIAQIATSLQDSSISALPKLVCCGIALLALLPWMARAAVQYASHMLGGLDRYVR